MEVKDRAARSDPTGQRELAAAEARQKVLVDEVNHRVKNTLATVQALAHYSLRGPGVDPALRQDFEGRLFALSSVHNQLARERWAGAEFGVMLHDLLAPYDFDERVYLNGPVVWLQPKSAIALAMALQELLTNAARYGALSVIGGHVTLDWSVSEAGSVALLQFDWREQGGPPVQTPRWRGLGSELLDHAIRAELNGTVRLDFDSRGLRCAAAVPLPGSRG